MPLPSRPVALDGDLREWGEAAWIPVEPAADGVGLRGVFGDDLDHEAVVLVQWDARYLYVAAAVHDDTLDAAWIAPGEREWHGPSGERRDRMFYYDHMKLFVREPGADAGYNLWFAPPAGASGEGGWARPWWWGGRQRRLPAERPPVEVAAQVRGRARTFEMAIPWTWLGAWPQPGDEFDALFLFVDSDEPEAAVGAKIGSGRGRWIWWEGHLVLRGTPEGLRPRPKPEREVMDRPVRVAEETPNPRVQQAIERSRRADSVAAVAAAAPAPRIPPGTRPETPLAVLSAEGAGAPAAAAPAPGPRPPSAQGDPAAAAPSGGGAVAPATGRERMQGSLRARLNRQLLARRAASRAPDWMRRLERDSRLSEAQVDSYYTVLHRHLRRIVVDDLSVRVDIFVVDMAAAAGGGRMQARRFLVDLLKHLENPEDERVRAWFARAAQQLELEAGAVGSFVEDLSSRSRKLFEERGAAPSDELLLKAAREAELSRPQARRLLGALAGIDDGISGW